MWKWNIAAAVAYIVACSAVCAHFTGLLNIGPLFVVPLLVGFWLFCWIDEGARAISLVVAVIASCVVALLLLGNVIGLSVDDNTGNIAFSPLSDMTGLKALLAFEAGMLFFLVLPRLWLYATRQMNHFW